MTKNSALCMKEINLPKVLQSKGFRLTILEERVLPRLAMENDALEHNRLQR
jgi:hypothetical protein